MIARTDPSLPKHRGISYFLLDMKTPGITVHSQVTMAGTRSFNEIFFDAVKVPKENMVGEKNRGWYVATTTLDIQRGFGLRGRDVAASRRTLEDLVRIAQETYVSGRPLAADPLVRHRLAEMAVEVEVARMLAHRVAWMAAQRLVANAEASILKVFASELGQRLCQLGIQLFGLYGPLAPGSPWAPVQGALERMYLSSVSSTIGAGTSEVQRNIIAMRGLGLPRG